MKRERTEASSVSAACARSAADSMSAGLPAVKHATAASASIATARSGSARAAAVVRISYPRITGPRRIVMWPES